jgi:hypothetical protein
LEPFKRNIKGLVVLLAQDTTKDDECVEPKGPGTLKDIENQPRGALVHRDGARRDGKLGVSGAHRIPFAGPYRRQELQ